MKAAIYNPYWDTLGGGERYTFSFAKVMESLGYSVDVEWRDKDLLQKIEDRFGIKSQNIRIVDDIQKGEGYDLCFWVSDGSIPLLHARNNYLHFQVPFNDVNGRTLLNRMKMYRIKSVICNSNFTKKVIDEEYKVNSLVVYPPCDTEKIKPMRKENVILTVGRFSDLLQSKHQDVLVDVFIKMCNRGLTGWRFVLAGGVDVGAGSVIDNLRKKIAGYPIEIIESPAYKEIVQLYGRSKIFWSASGWGVDEKKYPEKVEHFGISLVEAMSGECIPYAFSAGGYVEILSQFGDRFLWKDKNGLIRNTFHYINNPKGNRDLLKSIRERSKDFSYEKFAKRIVELL